MSNYTPGPWAADANFVAAPSADQFIVMCRGADGEANARLISAAPELLAALRALADAVEHYTNATPEDWPELAAARAAIAKATGEAA